jgi:hypothetical protein
MWRINVVSDTTWAVPSQVPGSARLPFADNVVHLDPAPVVFEAGRLASTAVSSTVAGQHDRVADSVDPPDGGFHRLCITGQ